jgi:hypothetical protein
MKTEENPDTRMAKMRRFRESAGLGLVVNTLLAGYKFLIKLSAPQSSNVNDAATRMGMLKRLL